MNHSQLKILRNAGSKIQFLIQTVEDKLEVNKLENISKLIDEFLLSSNPIPKIKSMIVSHAPGYSVYCPKCNDDKVVIFFDPKFVGRYRSVWIGLINERKIVLENKWDKIKVENQWIDINPKDAVPNWVCKNCYDGGIILEKK